MATHGPRVEPAERRLPHKLRTRPDERRFHPAHGRENAGTVRRGIRRSRRFGEGSSHAPVATNLMAARITPGRGDPGSAAASHQRGVGHFLPMIGATVESSRGVGRAARTDRPVRMVQATPHHRVQGDHAAQDVTQNPGHRFDFQSADGGSISHIYVRREPCRRLRKPLSIIPKSPTEGKGEPAGVPVVWVVALHRTYFRARVGHDRAEDFW